MKAVVSPHGCGPRGRLQVGAAVVVLMLVLAFVLGGCGGGAENKSTTGSQLDDEAAGATGSQTTGTGSSTVPVVSGNEPVLAGYTADQCIADMTARYGSRDIAQQVCTNIKVDYGSSTPQSQLSTILPKVESKLGVTSLPGAGVPGSGGTSAPPSNSDGSTAGGSSGWESEITVPPAPGGQGP